MPFAGFSQCGMSFSMVSQPNVCDGDCSQGSASIAGGVTGGTAPYTYLWDDPLNTTQFFITSDLCGSEAGIVYTITVTDNTGCAQTNSVTIFAPSPVVAALTSVDACFNQCNGQVILGATGGGNQSGSPYDYIFENASTTTTQTGTVDSLFTFTSLCPGSYNVTLTDPLGCFGTNSIVVNEASDYTRNITSTDATCFNKCNGTATVTIGGSQPPYTYLWSSGQTTSAATSLCGSQGGTTYQVTITDALGCVFDTFTEVAAPPEVIVNLDFQFDPTSPGACDGVIQVSATGGTGSPPYTFNWSSGQSASTLANLCAGSYTVTVTDGNGCNTTQTFVLNDFVGIAEFSGNVAVSIFPNPSQDHFFLEIGDPHSLVTLQITDLRGKVVLKDVLHDRRSCIINLESQMAGIYFLKLCSVDGSADIRKLVKY